MPDHPDDVFLPGGGVSLAVLSPGAARALEEALRLTRKTQWDSVRSPHVFMGLLADPDPSVRAWGERLGADLPRLLQEFQDIFFLKQGPADAVLGLNREFFSDNVIRLLREAWQRARDRGRQTISPMDLLICLLTAPHSIVVECFERVGFTAAKLTEWAVLAEQQAPGH
jgi:ATP-dependent Clp protease ATP-binding subunit ClpA